MPDGRPIVKRAFVAGLLLVPSVLIVASPSSAAQVPARHPLDPLDPDEIRVAVVAVREERPLADTSRFVSVALKEPPKELVTRPTSSARDSCVIQICPGHSRMNPADSRASRGTTGSSRAGTHPIFLHFVPEKGRFLLFVPEKGQFRLDSGGATALSSTTQLNDTDLASSQAIHESQWA
jgi:hypothetical protein